MLFILTKRLKMIICLLITSTSVWFEWSFKSAPRIRLRRVQWVKSSDLQMSWHIQRWRCRHSNNNRFSIAGSYGRYFVVYRIHLSRWSFSLDRVDSCETSLNSALNELPRDRTEWQSSPTSEPFGINLGNEDEFWRSLLNVNHHEGHSPGFRQRLTWW